MIVTVVLLVAFWWLVQKPPLGRAQRACEQDRKMAALLGIDVDRTISITFVIGAALAAVAGVMYLMYYGVVNFSDGFVPRREGFHRRGSRRHRLAARRGARRAPHRAHRDHVVGLFHHRLQGCRRFLHPGDHPHIPSDRYSRPA